MLEKDPQQRISIAQVPCGCTLEWFQPAKAMSLFMYKCRVCCIA